MMRRAAADILRQLTGAGLVLVPALQASENADAWASFLRTCDADEVYMDDEEELLRARAMGGGANSMECY